MNNTNIGKMYFARKRKLLEMEGSLKKASQSRKQKMEKTELKIQSFMIFAMVVGFLILINGTVVPPH